MRHEIFKDEARKPLKRRDVATPASAKEGAARRARALWSEGDPTKGMSRQADLSESRNHDALATTIEREIIPRLLLAHQKTPLIMAPREERPSSLSNDLAPMFLAMIRQGNVEAALVCIDGLRRRGMSHEAIYLDLLAPTARALGTMWENDTCDFTEVTVCTWRLQEVLHAVSHAISRQVECAGGQRRRFLLASLKGEQHTFGLAVVDAFLRHAGWDVLHWPGADAAGLAELVASEWFAVVGVTCSSRDGFDVTAPAIHAMRRASRNRALGVMAGGWGFIDHPEWAAHVGADATAADGRTTVSLAHNLMALLN